MTEATEALGGSHRTARGGGILQTAFLVALAGGAGLAALANPYFLQPENLSNLARNTGFYFVFALAQMLPILVRGLDLSQGGIVALTSVAAASMATTLGLTPAFALCLLGGAMIGLVQGVLVGRMGLSAFVVTLGAGSALGGVALIWSNGQTIFDVPRAFRFLGWTDPGGVPLIAIWAVLLLVGAAFVLRRTKFGRQVYAVGSNPTASHIIGIPNAAVIISCYVVSAMITCTGALFLSSRITSGSPVIGSEVALQSVAAAVVGGVSLFGGRGHPLGVFGGALALAMIANLLNLYNVSSYWQAVVFGVVIVLAVSFDRLRARR